MWCAVFWYCEWPEGDVVWGSYGWWSGDGSCVVESALCVVEGFGEVVYFEVVFDVFDKVVELAGVLV